ncbi:MAG: phosphotransferase [Acidimicrobiales bacterium]
MASRVRRDMTDDMRRFPSPAQLAWVERTVGTGARVTGGRRMFGGISSSVHRLSLRLPNGRSAHVVLKRFTDPGWGDTRAIVQNEAAALAAVEQMDVPAPRLLGISPGGAETDGVPSLLMTRAAGRVWLTPHDIDSWIRQLAILLPTLHAGSADVRTRQPRDFDALTVPESALRPEVWTAAKDVIRAQPPPTETVFIHGDYQTSMCSGRVAASARSSTGAGRASHLPTATSVTAG